MEYKSLEFMRRFASVGHDVRVFKHALILKPEIISLGDRIRIDDYCRLEGGQGIKIDEGTHIASFASILGGGRCEIGRFVGIAQGTRIVTGSGQPAEKFFDLEFDLGDPYYRSWGFVSIGDYAITGVNSVVLPNTGIGEGGILGAGSVLTKDIPAWSIMTGSPAVFKKWRNRYPRREKDS